MRITVTGTNAEIDKVISNITKNLRCPFENVLRCRVSTETKCLDCPHITKEVVAWRAKQGEDYYCVRFMFPSVFAVVMTAENFTLEDNMRYSEGNYFREEQAAWEKLQNVMTIVKEKGVQAK